ncbi:MAG: sodium:solute symporter family protein [Emergencia sp.]|nr:sodium:solute symporter family protein [Emergencia sp.]
MSIADIIVLIIYVVSMLAIGVVSKGKINSMDDFILGGKRFNKFALTGTIMATMVGSGMMMGAAGSSYTDGAGGTLLWIYFGFGFGLILMGLFSKRLRKTGARSLAEAISSAFGTNARLACAIVVVIYAASLVAINVAGLRTIIIYVFGDSLNLSMELATLIAVLIPIAFTAMGGFFAVVWTDTVQLVIMIVGIFVLGPIIGIQAAGGIDVITASYASEGLTLTNPLANGVSSGMIGLALSYVLASPGDPTMPQRALSAKDDKTATVSFTISGFIAFGFAVSLLLIGGAAHVLVPGLENADSALPMMIVQYYPPVVKGLAIAGMIAAIMSSFDSFLILATTHIMYDIGKVIKPDLSDEKIHKSLPILTVALGIVGALIALFISSLLGYLSMVFSIIGSSVVPALVAALYFREKTSKTAVTLSIIAGAVVPAVLFFTVGYDVFLGDPVFIGLFSSVGILILGSLVLKDKPEKLAE